jgi:hypothetical protein
MDFAVLLTVLSGFLQPIQVQKIANRQIVKDEISQKKRYPQPKNYR